ncbi:MAG TPA: HAD family hydrolase [Candidatus Acidoferrales bacterium]|nr:HAD family hydrolase [Candidatus Acidoferrales bacterium]
MNNSNRRRAAFLDRDGTIAEEVGYLNHLSRFHLFPFAAEAIRRLNEAGLAVVVVTNQAGATRSFFPEEFIPQVHEHMVRLLAAEGARIDAIYYCPHSREQACDCRKPRTGLLERAAREHDLEFEGSFVVGDRYADVQMAHSAGCRGILVMTGYGRGEYQWFHDRWARQPDSVVENLLDAADVILNHR